MPRAPVPNEPEQEVVVLIPAMEIPKRTVRFRPEPEEEPILPVDDPQDADYADNPWEDEEEAMEVAEQTEWAEGDEEVVAEAEVDAEVEAQAPVPDREDLGRYVAEDVDAWNVTVYPEDLIRIHGRKLTLVRLVSRAPFPVIRDAEMYRSWVYVAEGVGYFKVEPRFKEPLIRWFQQIMNIQPNSFGIAFSIGCPTVTLRILVEALRDVGCTSVRVQAYGMKLPLFGMCTEPANPDHPLAETNSWDLGVNYDSSDIWLVQYRHKPKRPNRHFPILNPLGKGYGSADIRLTTPKGLGIQLKVYPRLVHAIKAFNSKMARSEPRTMFTAKKRLTTVHRLMHDLGSVPSSMLGGLRMEISVTARSLEEATDVLDGLPYLSLKAFLDAEQSWIKPLQLQLLTVRVSDMLQNVRHLYSIASAHSTMSKRDRTAPTELAKKMIADLLNSLGWNTGLRQPTRWNNNFAWWIRAASAPTVVSNQVAEATIPPTVDVPKLFQAIRLHFPCRDCEKEGSRYHSVGGRQRFVLRCSDCGKRLNRNETVAHLGHLLSLGNYPVDLGSFGITVRQIGAASASQSNHLGTTN